MNDILLANQLKNAALEIIEAQAERSSAERSKRLNGVSIQLMRTAMDIEQPKEDHDRGNGLAV